MLFYQVVIRYVAQPKDRARTHNRPRTVWHRGGPLHVLPNQAEPHGESTLVLSKQTLYDEHHVGGALGEAAREVAVPVLTIGYVYSYGMSTRDQRPLQIRLHTIQELELVA